MRDIGHRQHAVLLLTRFRPGGSLWGLAQLMRGPFQRVSAPGLVFQKILGSGQNGGFGLRPGLNYQGVFSVFDTHDHARAYLRDSPQVQAYADHAEELFAAHLEPVSCRGSWSGFAFEGPLGGSGAVQQSDFNPSGLMASLTRASIRPHKARAFWAQSPDAETDLAKAQGCQLAVGLGEAPILRQATFSLWSAQAAMDAYARSGGHQRAIQAAYGHDFFSESMFVRFQPIALWGRWKEHHFQPWSALGVNSACEHVT